MNIATIPLEKRNLLSVMESAIRERSEQTAVADPHGSLSYEELWNGGLAISGSVEALGVQRQATVLVLLDNHVDNALAWLGILIGGRVEVSINTAYRGRMLAYIINDSQSELIVLDAGYLPRLKDISEELQTLKKMVVRGMSESDLADVRRDHPKWDILSFDEFIAGTAASPSVLNPWDLASVTYTSGTTGRSKGVLCPHAHAFGHSTGDGLGFTHPGETRMVVLPQFHAAGRWGGVYNSLIHGATAHLTGSFSASQFWHQAKEVDARTSELVGSMAQFIWTQPQSPADRDHAMREICILPLPKNMDEWSERFGVRILSSYGSTEAGSITNAVELKESSVGRVRDGYDVRIFDDHDRELPDGDVGEAVVRADLPWTTSVGYLGQPEATAESWRNGWFHTGDALYRDAEGNFYFVDRLDDAIRRRGENVSSMEVEMHVLAHPAVLECAAVAVPSEFIEDEIKIVVVVEPGMTLSANELIAFLEEEMPAFMVPRYVQFQTELPRTATEKVRKNEIRSAGTEGCWDRSANAQIKETPDPGNNDSQ